VATELLESVTDGSVILDTWPTSASVDPPTSTDDNREMLVGAGYTLLRTGMLPTSTADEVRELLVQLSDDSQHPSRRERIVSKLGFVLTGASGSAMGALIAHALMLTPQLFH
jgi:hypothetical protein